MLGGVTHLDLEQGRANMRPAAIHSEICTQANWAHRELSQGHPAC